MGSLRRRRGPRTPLAASAEPLGAATPGPLLECEALVDFEYASTVITGAELIAAGVETNAGTPVGEHCRVTGHMNERVSEVDDQTYRIGFEMRLPADWSGRYLYQANGGIDGSVAKAMGNFTGGQLASGLQQGFAVLSSDAGHGSPAPFFGSAEGSLESECFTLPNRQHPSLWPQTRPASADLTHAGDACDDTSPQSMPRSRA